MSEILEKKKRGKLTWAYLTCVATWRTKWLAQPTCPPPLSSSSFARRTGACPTRAHHRAPPPACRPRPWTSGRPPRRRPDHLDPSIRPQLLSLSPGPTKPKLPSTTLPELRIISSFILYEPSLAGCPAAPPPTPSSSSGRRDRLRRPARSGPSPSSPIRSSCST